MKIYLSHQLPIFKPISSHGAPECSPEHRNPPAAETEGSLERNMSSACTHRYAGHSQPLGHEANMKCYTNTLYENDTKVKPLLRKPVK